MVKKDNAPVEHIVEAYSFESDDMKSPKAGWILPELK